MAFRPATDSVGSTSTLGTDKYAHQGDMCVTDLENLLLSGFDGDLHDERLNERKDYEACAEILCLY